MAKDFGLLDSLGEPEGKPDSASGQAAQVRRSGPTHEQQVRGYLKAIAWFTGIVAVATVANIVVQVVLGIEAASKVAGY